MALAIGVDIGGTKVAAGLVDEDGTVVARVRRHTPSLDPVGHRVDARRGDPRAGRARWTRSTAVGIGAAGFVDPDRVQRPVRAQPGLARGAAATAGRGAHRASSRGRERRQRRRMGGVPVRSGTRRARRHRRRRRHRASAAASCSAGSCTAAVRGTAGEWGHLRLVPDGPAVRVRPPRLLGAVRQRQRRWSARRASERPRCRRPPRGLLAYGGRDRRGTDRPDDHRAPPRRATRWPWPASRTSGAGWAAGWPKLVERP